jgi:hypothetical protein
MYSHDVCVWDRCNSSGNTVGSVEVIRMSVFIDATESPPVVIDAWFGQPDYRNYIPPDLKTNDEIEVYYETETPGTVLCYVDGELQKSERIAENSITPNNTYMNKFMVTIPETALDKEVLITIRGDNAKFLRATCKGSGSGRVVAILPPPGHGLVPGVGGIDRTVWVESPHSVGRTQVVGAGTEFAVHFNVVDATPGALLVEVFVNDTHHRWYTIDISRPFERREFFVPVVIDEPWEYRITLRLGRNVEDEIQIDSETDELVLTVREPTSSLMSRAFSLGGYAIPIPYVAALGVVGLYAMIRR